ncbi:hypothetical protein M2451_001920 [Dysgonomonas sp. PFB1-18]|uniref:DUF5074 domain-containing protein n=1 Tax=unclassified Dysgonomonas TaxID=2630389 RepID=UPI002476723A|nr:MULTISPECIES: DUF5074 domain-containing protein [unclassified Dysgonomonas]MDH6309554.1 hypothetical protein [Dysgonomonas sp. PF1-14]MDH6339118.1 hypothetical protein [Dysgonomonas sp. PF1-16]MDH6380596.1 hypothetical protein [Dysgonomonas sp. PFB1-18]MDH6398092.1 hypothetical protein [Dysgonomonas sp. PF1-23]
MKKLLYYTAFALFLGFASCSDDDDIVTTPDTAKPETAIVNLSGITSVAQGDTIYLKANVTSDSKSKFVWSVNDDLKSTSESLATDSLFKFVKKEPGNYIVTLTCINPNGESSTKVNLTVYGKYRNGTFILNEGSAFQENSFLTFISPNGEITDSVYWKANGTELGNGAEDLFIGNGKMYIISQNGKSNIGKYDSDGMLIIANAETLKKEVAYNDKISVLSWPTHIAVLGTDNIFIRDGNGVYLFNTTTGTIKFVDGTKGALKNRMAVVENKVFVPASRSILVLEAGKTVVSHKIELDAAVSGVIKTADGNLYVSTTGTPNKILKINAKDYSVIKTNEVTEGKVGAGFGATPGISAKGDTIYYSNASTKIYRHIFSTGTSEYLTDAKEHMNDAGMAYNNLAVHPVSGEVYQTTIKGYGTNFLLNNISVFNFSKPEPVLVNNYKHHTHFPAGIFFIYDFD